MIRAIAIGVGLVAIVAGFAVPADARPTPAQKCGANKLRCVAKEFVGAAACHAKAILAGTTADEGCLAAAQSKQARCWQAAESKGGCAATFPAEHLHEDVADWTADVAGDVTPN